jgi:hypothetical protein
MPLPYKNKTSSKQRRDKKRAPAPGDSPPSAETAKEPGTLPEAQAPTPADDNQMSVGSSPPPAGPTVELVMGAAEAEFFYFLVRRAGRDLADDPTLINQEMHADFLTKATIFVRHFRSMLVYAEGNIRVTKGPKGWNGSPDLSVEGWEPVSWDIVGDYEQRTWRKVQRGANV